jgi:sugar (pentulose or hexulose) kinase
MMPTLLGIDLGTSSFKASAYRDSGEELGTVTRPTPWQSTSDGAQLDPSEFADVVRSLAEDCASAFANGNVAAIGVTGMAETVFVETAAGQTLPARAWNGHGNQAALLPDDETFAITGLLDAARTTAATLRGITDAGVDVRSWSGLPEYAVRSLGGAAVAERSLAARTGLVDVLAAEWSPQLIAWARVERAVLPALQPAGQASGEAALAGPCAGAVLTVAGHDHLVAALGAGAWRNPYVFDSLGTGEALLAQVAAPPDELDATVVAGFNAAGFNVGLGLDEQGVIALCGLGTGNRFNLLLAALAAEGFQRDDVMSAPGKGSTPRIADDAAELLETLFGPNWQTLRASGTAGTVIRRSIPDVAAANALWWAAIARASRNTRAALDAMRELVPHATRLVAAGGWLADPGIRKVREHIIGPFEVPQVGQCGTRGAALLAGLAAGVYASRDDFPSLTGTGATV